MSTIESTVELTRSGRNVSTGRQTLNVPLSAATCPRSLIGRLDWIERLIVLAFYLWLVARILGNYAANGGLANLLLLPSEGLAVFFLLFRRRAQTISAHPTEWLVAIVATCSPMLVRPEPPPLVPPLIGASVVLMGITIQVMAKIALGRSLGLVPAHRGLRLNGPYRFVRHPMYAGYALSHVGFLLMNPTLWNVAMYVACTGLQIFRLLAEERLLRRDPRYRRYQTEVRCRLVPGIF
jgi:protein-S-isoprenylcysteine O-methyltransferase Ste14